MKSPVPIPMRGIERCDGACLFFEFFRDSRESMFITTRDGSFIDVNRSMAGLLGYTPEELKGRFVEEIYEAPEERRRFQREIEEAGVVHDFQAALIRKDGTILFCLIDAIVWRHEGETAGYHGLIRTRDEILSSFRNYFNRLKEELRLLKEERRNLFSDSTLLVRYVNDEMLEYIRKTGRNPMETANRKVTILFFDIRRSTGIAESLNPETFAEFLSEIFTDIMDLIYGAGGSVNKMLGDGLMATFGAPLGSNYDACNAVGTAVQIQDYLTTYNDVRPECIGEPVEAGIGIATGVVFTGVIGSVHRQEYAVLGDAVNVASRLEALTRSTGERILIDEATFAEVQEQYPCRRVYRGRLKGRAEKIRIYSV